MRGKKWQKLKNIRENEKIKNIEKCRILAVFNTFCKNVRT